MDENKINETYDKLMNDSVSAQEKIEALNDFAKSDNEESSNNIVENDAIIPSTNSTPESEEVMVNYDATTGEITPGKETSSDKIKKFTESQFNDFVNGDNEEYVLNGIKDFLSNNKQLDEIKNIDDIIIISNLVKRSMNGEKVNAWAEFPDSIKQMIMTKTTTPDRRVVKAAADAVLKEIVEEYRKKNISDLESILANFNNGGEDMIKDFSKEFGDMLLDIDKSRREQIDAAIEACKEKGNTEGVEKFEKMKNAIDNAYNLKDFSEFCKKVKIKNYELEKPEKVFRDFNMKYINHKNTINDISYCPYILDRHLENEDDNTKICVAFCKYAKNMSPDNIEDHTFMYYFIRNIMTIDRVNPKGKGYDTMNDESKQFYDTFINNLKTCIEHINTRLINVVK